MSSLDTEEDLTSFEILDFNMAVGFLTYIVDIWEGDRDDPAVGITRYIGVWRQEDLMRGEEAFQPDFTHKKNSYSYRRQPRPEPLVWDEIEQVKEAERDAEMYKDQQDSLMNEERYSYGANRNKKALYQAFMAAVDVLAADPENEEAWAAVDAYRTYQAHEHER